MTLPNGFDLVPITSAEHASSVILAMRSKNRRLTEIVLNDRDNCCDEGDRRAPEEAEDRPKIEVYTLGQFNHVVRQELHVIQARRKEKHQQRRAWEDTAKTGNDLLRRFGSQDGYRCSRDKSHGSPECRKQVAESLLEGGDDAGYGYASESSDDVERLQSSSCSRSREVLIAKGSLEGDESGMKRLCPKISLGEKYGEYDAKFRARRRDGGGKEINRGRGDASLSSPRSKPGKAADTSSRKAPRKKAVTSSPEGGDFVQDGSIANRENQPAFSTDHHGRVEDSSLDDRCVAERSWSSSDEESQDYASRGGGSRYGYSPSFGDGDDWAGTAPYGTDDECFATASETVLYNSERTSGRRKTLSAIINSKGMENSPPAMARRLRGGRSPVILGSRAHTTREQVVGTSDRYRGLIPSRWITPRKPGVSSGPIFGCAKSRNIKYRRVQEARVLPHLQRALVGRNEAGPSSPPRPELPCIVSSSCSSSSGRSFAAAPSTDPCRPSRIVNECLSSVTMDSKVAPRRKIKDHDEKF